MKIETLKELILNELPKCSTIEEFSQRVLWIIDLYEKDLIDKKSEVPFNIGTENKFVNNLTLEGSERQSSCSKCGLKFIDELGRPISMCYSCPDMNCPCGLGSPSYS